LTNDEDRGKQVINKMLLSKKISRAMKIGDGIDYSDDNMDDELAQGVLNDYEYHNGAKR
jgi:hypothetical protein